MEQSWLWLNPGRLRCKVPVLPEMLGDEVIKSYISGTLAEIGEVTCDHHEHEGHGEHGCGNGGCH